MTRRTRLTVAIVASAIALAVSTASAGRPDWDNPLWGTWSGNWQTESSFAAVTVRFEFDGDVLVGKILNPAQMSFSRFDFDEEALTVVAEAQNDEGDRFTLEARIEETTRLNGTLTRKDSSGQVSSGEMRLTKWTFRAR